MTNSGGRLPTAPPTETKCAHMAVSRNRTWPGAHGIASDKRWSLIPLACQADMDWVRSYPGGVGPNRRPILEELPEGADWKDNLARLLKAVAQATSELPSTWPVPRTERCVASLEASVDAETPSELERTFLALAERWRRDTEPLSSITMKSMHPAYQRIVGMGRRALPLVFREMRRAPDHWFWALTAITGEDPVEPEDAGDIEKMTEAWLSLGKRRGWT